MFNDKITLNVAEAIAKVLNKNLDVSEGLIDDLKDNKKIRQETDWYHDKNDRQEKKKSEPNIKTFTGKYGKSNYKSVSENLSDIDEQKDVKHEIHVDGKYIATTTRAKTAKEARENFLKAYPEHTTKKIQVNRILEDFEQEDVTYEEMNEGWGAREQQQRRDAQNKAWDELLDKHKEHPKNTEKLKNLRLKNWSAPAAEKMLREDSEQLDEVADKVYDPITKKNVKRKPIKIKMGGGYRKTVDGVVVDSSDKKEIGKKFSESLSIFSEKGLKGLFESIYSVSDETVEIINETSEFVGIPQSINTIRKTKEHLKVNTNLPKSIRKELEQKIEDHRKHLEKSGFDFKEDFDNIDWETLLEEPDSDEFAQEVKKAVRKNKGELRNDENIAKGEVLAVKNEEVEYIDEMKKLNKVNHVYSDVNAEKFADEYVKGHSGDYREGGPTKQDSEHSENFHTNYTTKHVKSGFAGGGKKIFTHNKTGEKFEVEIEPNGKTFYGNDHRVRKLNEEIGDLDEMTRINSNKKDDSFEVYGVKGMNSKQFRKTFNNQQEYEKWLEKNGSDITIHGHRKLNEEVEDLDEAHMTDTEMEKREEIVKGMKKNLSSFKDRYGNRAKDVMYATATKKAMAD